MIDPKLRLVPALLISMLAIGCDKTEDGSKKDDAAADEKKGDEGDAEATAENEGEE